jgi:hypothetical protein
MFKTGTMLLNALGRHIAMPIPRGVQLCNERYLPIMELLFILGFKALRQ